MAVCSELATSYFCLAAIVGVDVLDFCVRDGNRYFHIAVITRTIVILLISRRMSTVDPEKDAVLAVFRNQMNRIPPVVHCARGACAATAACSSFRPSFQACPASWSTTR